MKLPIIKTKRLILKALTDIDAEALFEYRAELEIQQYQIWKPKILKEVQNFIKKYTQEFNAEGTWFQLGIYEKK